MKGLISRMLRERGTSHSDMSKVLMYSACSGCLQLLCYYFFLIAAVDTSEAVQISQQDDNIHWILDALINRQIADDSCRSGRRRPSSLSFIQKYQRPTGTRCVELLRGYSWGSKKGKFWSRRRLEISKAHIRPQAERVLVLKLACQVFVGILEQEGLLV